MTKAEKEKKEKEHIIYMATALRFEHNTKDPFVIAKKLGIEITWNDIDSGSSYNGIKSGKKEIRINRKYEKDYIKQKVICAHELGHIYLEHAGKKYYKDFDLDKEYCANLFAVTLMFGTYAFNRDIAELDNYTLQNILDCNLK